MLWILLGIVVLVLLAIAVKFIPKTNTNTNTNTDFPYCRTDPLFTPAERSFFGVLKKAVGDHVEIFAKVRVADVINPQKGLSRSEWQIAFNKIAKKHFD
jgi:hypothetical protein